MFWQRPGRTAFLPEALFSGRQRLPPGRSGAATTAAETMHRGYFGKLLGPQVEIRSRPRTRPSGRSSSPGRLSDRSNFTRVYCVTLNTRVKCSLSA